MGITELATPPPATTLKHLEIKNADKFTAYIKNLYSHLYIQLIITQDSYTNNVNKNQIPGLKYNIKDKV